MFLTIVLRKEVPDVPAAQALTEAVKNKLADQPDVTITASVSAQLIIEEIEP